MHKTSDLTQDIQDTRDTFTLNPFTQLTLKKNINHPKWKQQKKRILPFEFFGIPDTQENKSLYAKYVMYASYSASLPHYKQDKEKIKYLLDLLVLEAQHN